MEPVNDSDSSSDDDSVDSSSSSDNSSDDDAASHNSSDDSINSQQEDLEDENVSVDQQKAEDDDSNSENSRDSQEEYQDEYKSLRERILEKEARGSKKYSASRSDKKSKALQKAMKGLESFKKRKQQQQNAEKNNDTVLPPKKKKKSKHKPTEVSSKRADFFARGAKRFHESGLGVDDIGAHRYKPMDPRLSNLTGHFDEDRFSKNYAFLEEMRNQEIGKLRKQMQAHKQTGKRGNRMRRKQNLQHIDMEETQTKLKALTETRANLERQKMDRAAKQSVKRKLKEQVESGKSGVYFLKRKEKKRLELEAKYEQMSQKRGGKDFQKTLAKKRQKNKSKDAGVFVK